MLDDDMVRDEEEEEEEEEEGRVGGSIEKVVGLGWVAF